MNQKRTPLFDTLYSHARRKVVSFHTPGHKNGESIEKKLKSFTGRNVYYFDVTVFPEVDSLHDPVGPIKKAQELAAAAYGVDHTFFMVNGSSGGNIAMFLSTLGTGDSVIVSRNAHKSVLAGIILSGVWPIWLQPPTDERLKIIYNSSPRQIEEALTKFPEAKAVFITSPTYNGVVTDLFAIAEICHRRGKLLLVDEAHGPHLKFHKDLPVSAVETGADMCIQSTHKILSALSQGSMLHVNSDMVDINTARKIVSLIQTTSPNYLTLASLDLARYQAVIKGEKMLDKVIKTAERARRRINRMEFFSCFTREEIKKNGYDLDVTKLTINTTRTGLSGYEIEDILAREYNVQVDCADSFNLIAIMGIGSTPRDTDALVSALSDIEKKYVRKTAPTLFDENEAALHLPPLSTEMVMTPREVFFAKKTKRIPLRAAAGHISAQTLTPYPPGIPVLIPGERITTDIVEYIQNLVARKIRISGQETDSLKTIKIVAS